MAANTVTVSGMFGDNKTYFADSPVVIDISGLQWPESSPFDIIRVDVLYDGNTVGKFPADTGGQSSISFDISSALRAIWAGFDFSEYVGKALLAETASDATGKGMSHSYRPYSLEISTEYIDGTDKEFVTTGSQVFAGGRCLLGGLTEWERTSITNKSDADASYWEYSNLRNGDASTKPTSSMERVGKSSITSWVDINNSGVSAVYYPSGTVPSSDSTSAHAPMVLRDNIDYVDFLFVNRRGVVETCSARMFDALSVSVETKAYSRIERPTFQPSRSLVSISSGGRKSWAMSSGYQTREWAEWWVMEFLAARQWWMYYKGAYVPVTVVAEKNDINIYDHTKQQMPHVDFTVTLALEG